MSDSATIRRAYTTILHHFVATGRAPHFAELAHSVEVTPETTVGYVTSLTI